MKNKLTVIKVQTFFFIKHVCKFYSNKSKTKDVEIVHLLKYYTKVFAPYLTLKYLIINCFNKAFFSICSDFVTKIKVVQNLI